MLFHIACPLPVPPPQAGEGTLGREPSSIQWGSDRAPLNEPEVGPDE
jgi:hypothetical protein